MATARKPATKRFADFIQMFSQTPEQVVLVHHHEVIADTYDEIVDSMNRLPDVKKSLMIIRKRQRF